MEVGDDLFVYLFIYFFGVLIQVPIKDGQGGEL